jgi:hypothetical protein
MTQQSIPRFPLEWPLGWKRVRQFERVRGTFQQTTQELVQTEKGAQRVGRTGRVSLINAVKRLEDQLERLGAKNAVLSTNVSLRLDGRPRSGEEPTDPGAAIYFSYKGKPTVFACDRYERVADNVAAMASHIDALRRIDRYGVGSLEQALAGYKALPADTAADWRSVFGFPKDSRPTPEQVDVAYKKWAREKHPDVGGSDIEMAHLNRARDFAMQELVQ